MKTVFKTEFTYSKQIPQEDAKSRLPDTWCHAVSLPVSVSTRPMGRLSGGAVFWYAAAMQMPHV